MSRPSLDAGEEHLDPEGSILPPGEDLAAIEAETVFAKDALEFKKLVTDMRFDEVSAKYADFGNFYVGKIVTG